MGWLIFLGILALLGCLPLGVRLNFDEGGFRAAVLIGRIPVRLYPVPKWLQNMTSKHKKEEQSPEPKPRRAEPQSQAQTGGGIQRFLPFARLGLELLGDFRRKLRVNFLRLRLTLAGEDPCDLAVNYGRAWAALGNLMPRLERALVIRKRDVEIQCDFQAEETTVVFAMDLTMTLGRLLGLALGYGLRALKLFLTMKKAVQTNE